MSHQHSGCRSTLSLTLNLAGLREMESSFWETQGGMYKSRNLVLSASVPSSCPTGHTGVKSDMHLFAALPIHPNSNHVWGLWERNVSSGWEPMELRSWEL